MNEPLKNILVESKGSDLSYEIIPAGLQLCGLVKIKEATKKKFKEEGEDPAYRFVFRSKENPDAFITTTVRAFCGRRANLYKLVQIMSGGALKGDVDRTQMFQIMSALIGKWFNCMVEHTQYQGNTWAQLMQYMATPAVEANKEVGDCTVYFSQFDPEHSSTEKIPPSGDLSDPDEEQQSIARDTFTDDDIPF